MSRLMYRLLPYMHALLLFVAEGTIWPVCDVRRSCIVLLLQLLPFCQGIRARHVVCRLLARCPAYNRQLLRHVCSVPVHPRLPFG
jgi:hypothetical protein